MTKFMLITGLTYTNSYESFSEIDELQPEVLSVLVEGNKILKVGTSEILRKFIEKHEIKIDTEIVLDEDEILLPGFVDSHVHPFAGQIKTNLNCSVTGLSFSETITKIKDFVESNPDKEWYFIQGYSDDIFKPENSIHYSILDQISVDKPISVGRYDYHAVWVNSKALSISKVTKEWIDPHGGVIERNSNGELIGVFSDSALDLIFTHAPKLDLNDKQLVLEGGLRKLVSSGITSINDACVKENTMTDIYLQLYSDEKRRKFFPRCSLSFSPQKFSVFHEPTLPKIDINKVSSEFIDTKYPYLSEFGKAMIKSIEYYFKDNRTSEWFESNNYGGKLKVNCVKLFIDGVFESKTAYIHSKYSNCSCQDDENGKSSFNEEELAAIFEFLILNKLQAHCHTIGDKAITLTLDSIKTAYEKQGVFKLIEEEKIKIMNILNISFAHIQVCQNEDIKKMKSLGIKGNFSPLWFAEDSASEIVHNLIGKENVDQIYPIKLLLNEGLTVGFGSDWPVTSEVPIEGIEVAVTHKPLGVDYIETYNKTNLLSLKQAIDIYTKQSASLLGLESQVGSIEEGKLADLIIINKNIFDSALHKIHEAKVNTTIIDGEIVYQRK